MDYFIKYIKHSSAGNREVIEYVQGSEQKLNNTIKRIQSENKHPVFLQVFSGKLESEEYNY